MASGGARVRSGPPKDPNSKRSEDIGLNESLRVLPKGGYTGKAPEWPLPKGTQRERALWRKIWGYPQAAAWAGESWRWLMIAQYVVWLVRAEQPESTPSVMTQVMRLADSIGLTPAGLLLNGWKIENDIEQDSQAATKPAHQRRMRVVRSESQVE